MHLFGIKSSGVLRLLAVAVFCFLANRGRCAIALTHTTFSAENMPRITAEQSDILAIQSIIGTGGYYKLRAKILVTYDP